MNGQQKNLYQDPQKMLLLATLVFGAILTQIPSITIDISTEGFLHENRESFYTIPWDKQLVASALLVLVHREAANN